MALRCLECHEPLADAVTFCPACRLKHDLILVLQMAYRKHVLDDDTIGWQELEDRLRDGLLDALGPEGFEAWLDQIDTSAEGGAGG